MARLTKWSRERCEGSGIRKMLSVGDETARETRCPRCGRALKVRPTRGSSYLYRNPQGHPQATLPQHKRKEQR